MCVHLPVLTQPATGIEWKRLVEECQARMPDLLEQQGQALHMGTGSFFDTTSNPNSPANQNPVSYQTNYPNQQKMCLYPFQYLKMQQIAIGNNE